MILFFCNLRISTTLKMIYILTKYALLTIARKHEQVTAVFNCLLIFLVDVRSLLLLLVVILLLIKSTFLRILQDLIDYCWFINRRTLRQRVRSHIRRLGFLPAPSSSEYYYNNTTMKYIALTYAEQKAYFAT